MMHSCPCPFGGCFPLQKAFITLGSPVVPLLSTSKADSGLASEFRWDRAIYTAYERMLKVNLHSLAFLSTSKIIITMNRSFDAFINNYLDVLQIKEEQ